MQQNQQEAEGGVIAVRRSSSDFQSILSAVRKNQLLFHCANPLPPDLWWFQFLASVSSSHLDVTSGQPFCSALWWLAFL